MRTPKNNPPMFSYFSCPLYASDLSECSNPLGLTRNIHNCGPYAVGIQCVRKYHYLYFFSTLKLVINVPLNVVIKLPVKIGKYV